MRDAGSREWAAVVVNYESGPLLLDVRALAARRRRAPVPPRSSSSTTARADGSVDAVRGGVPATSRWSTPGTQPRLRGRRQPGHRGDDRARRRGVQRRPRGAGRARAAAVLARFDAEPDLAAVGPALLQPRRLAVPVGPRARVVASTRVGHALLGRIWPRNRFTRRYRQLDADWTRPRDVDWVSGAVLYLRRSRGRLGRRLGRALLHVHGGRRPVLAPAPARVAGRVRAGRPRSLHVQGASTAGRPYRMIVEHHRSVYRFAARRWRGAQRLLLVPLAALLAVARDRRHGGAGAADASRDAEGQRVTCDPPCPSPAPAISAPRCAPSTASPSGGAADRSAGTSPSRSWSSSASSPSSSTRGGGDSAGSGPPRARRPGRQHGRRPLAHRARRQHLRRVARARARVREAVRQPEPGGQRGDPLPRRRSDPHAPLRRRRGGQQRRPSASSSTTAGGGSRRLHRPRRLEQRARAVAGPDVRRPSETSWSNGDTCPFGQYKGEKVQLTWAVDGKKQTGNPADYQHEGRRDGRDLLPPKGAEHAVPARRVHVVRRDLRRRTARSSARTRRVATETTTTTAPATTARPRRRRAASREAAP